MIMISMKNHIINDNIDSNDDKYFILKKNINNNDNNINDNNIN